jgi:O-methyltransferase
MMDKSTKTDTVNLYLDLLAKTLTRSICEDNDEILGYHGYYGQPHWKQRLGAVLASAFRPLAIELIKKRPYDHQARELGRDWPARAETMVGLRGLANARHCIESVIADDVPGDIFEAGVWRGGTAIFMRGVLKAYQIKDRTVWCADSFQGLPPSSRETYVADKELQLDRYEYLAVDVESVRHNFVRFGLLDEQVKFLIGWFKDTLPNSPIDQLSILRCDGDLYESTIQTLEALYPRLSVGGYCIIDDYGILDGCRQAVNDYRRLRQVTDEILDVNGWCVYWRRTS